MTGAQSAKATRSVSLSASASVSLSPTRSAKESRMSPRSVGSCMPRGREQEGGARASRPASHLSRYRASEFPRSNSYDPGVKSIAPFYDRWGQYNGRLVDAIRNLSDEQLTLRATPTYWPIWAIAGHTAGARVYWLCGVFKEPGAETTPFTDPLSGVGWEDDESRPRGSAEVVTALDS